MVDRPRAAAPEIGDGSDVIEEAAADGVGERVCDRDVIESLQGVQDVPPVEVEATTDAAVGQSPRLDPALDGADGDVESVRHVFLVQVFIAGGDFQVGGGVLSLWFVVRSFHICFVICHLSVVCSSLRRG